MKSCLRLCESRIDDQHADFASRRCPATDYSRCMPTTLGPNTKAPLSVLHERCLYCAGEDRRELLQALAKAGPPDACEAVERNLEQADGARFSWESGTH